MTLENVVNHVVHTTSLFQLVERPILKRHESTADGMRRPMAARPHIHLSITPKLLRTPGKLEDEWDGCCPPLVIECVKLTPCRDGMIGDIANKCERFLRLETEQRGERFPQGRGRIEHAVPILDREMMPVVVRDAPEKLPWRLAFASSSAGRSSLISSRAISATSFEW